MSRLAEIESGLAAPVQVRVAWDKTIDGAIPPITSVECVGHYRMRDDALELLEFAKETILVYGYFKRGQRHELFEALRWFGEHIARLTDDDDAP